MSGSCAPTVAPDWVPGWVFCPGDRIIREVAEWIVGGFLDLTEAGVGFVLSYWNIVRGAFAAAGGDVWLAFVAVADGIQGAIFALNSEIIDIAASSGLAGPLVAPTVFLMWAVLSAAALRGLIVLLRKVRIWVV